MRNGEVSVLDTLGGYEAWRQNHPALAECLPIVATTRGRHVCFLANTPR